MKFADSTDQRNHQAVSQQLDSLVDALKAKVQTAAEQGDSFDSVERDVLKSVLRIGYQALELLLSLFTPFFQFEYRVRLFQN